MSGENTFVGLKIELKIPSNREIDGKVEQIQEYLNNKKVNIKFNISDDALKGLEKMAKMSEKAVANINKNKVDILNNEDFQKSFEQLKSNLSSIGKITDASADKFGNITVKIDEGTNKVRELKYAWDEVEQSIKNVNEIQKESIKQNFTTKSNKNDNLGVNADIKNKLKDVQEYYAVSQNGEKALIQSLQERMERTKQLTQAMVNKQEIDRKDAQLADKNRLAEEKQLSLERQQSIALNDNKKKVQEYRNAQLLAQNEEASARKVNLINLKAEAVKRKQANEEILADYKSKFASQVDSAKNTYGTHINTKALDDLLLRMNQIKTSTPNMKGAFTNLNGELQGFMNTARLAQKEASLMSRHVFDLGEAVELAGFKMFIWQSVGDLFFGAMTKIREGFDFMLEQTQLFTNLQMEMTDTNLNFQEITSTANKFGQEMGTTTSNVMKAISVFGTYTSTLDEVLVKSKAAIILSNITGEPVEKSSDELMAILAQFRLKAEESMNVVNTVAAVARNLQVDYPKAVAEISNGMRTVGAVAQEAGVGVGQLSAMLGTLVETTRRSGSQVANGLKTIFSRLQRVSEETNPEEFKKVEKALWGVGVAMKVNGDQMRPTAEVLEELASKWKNLTDIQRNNVAEQAAGVYQRNIFLSLMQNYDKVLSNTESAMESEGVAMEKQEIYAKSLTASINELKNKWEELYQIAINSDSWRLVVDGLTGAMSAFNSFGKLVGGIPAILSTAVFALTMFSSKARAGLSTFTGALVPLQQLKKDGIMPVTQIGEMGLYFGRLNGVINRLVGNFQLARLNAEVLGKVTVFTNLSSGAQALIATMRSYITTAGLATAATIVWQSAVTLGLSVAISYLVGKIFEIADAWTHAEERNKEAFDTLKNSITTLNQEISSAEKLAVTYKVLKNHTQLTVAEKEKLVDVQKQIAQLFPATITGYDNEGNAISDNIKLTEELIKMKKEELDLKRMEMAGKFLSDDNKTFDDYNKALKNIEDLKKKRDKMMAEGKTSMVQRKEYGGGVFSSNFETITLDDVNKKLIENNENYVKARMNLLEMTKAFVSTTQEGEKLSSGTLTKISNSLTQLSGVNKEKIISLFSNINADKVNDYIKQLKDIEESNTTNVESTNVYKEAVDYFGDALEKAGIKGANAKEFLNNVIDKNASKEVVDQVQNLVGNMDTLMEDFKGYGETLATYNQLLADAAEGKKINAEEAMGLIQKNRELIKVFTIEGDTVKINTKALNGLRTAKLADVNDTIKAENTKLQALKSRLIQELNINDKTISSLQLVAQARAMAYNVARKTEIKNMQNAGVNISDNFTGDKYDQMIWSAKAQNTALGQLANDYEDQMRMVDQIGKLKGLINAGNYGVSGGSGKSKGGGKSSKSGKSPLQSELETFKSDLKKAQEEYNETVKVLQNKVTLGIVTGMDVFKERIKNQESYVNKLFDIPSSLNQKLAEMKAKQKEYKPNTKEWKAIQGIIVKLNADIKQLPLIQQQEINKLNSSKKNMEAMDTLAQRRVTNLKTQLGLLRGVNIGEEAIKQKEEKINEMYKKIEDLSNEGFANEQVIKDNQAKITSLTAARNKFKSNTKEWKNYDNQRKSVVADNEKLISQNKRINAEKDETVKRTIDYIAELNKTKEVQDKINKDVANSILNKKFNLGFVQGFEMLDAQLENSKNNVDDLLNKLEDSKTTVAQLQNLLGDKDTTAEQKKTILSMIDQEIGKQKDIETSLDNEVKTYKEQKDIIGKIIKATDTLKDKLKSTVDTVKSLVQNFRDAIDDIIINARLNDKLQTDVFGSASEIFDSIDNAYKQKLVSLEKFKLQLTRVNKEVGTKFSELLDKQANGTITAAEKAQLQELTTSLFETNDEIKQLLAENGLSPLEIASLYDDYNKILDIRKSQKDEIDKIQKDIIPKYEKELELTDSKVESQFSLNRLKYEEIGLTKTQLDLDKVLNDRRFEFISASGEKFLTFDRQQAKDLSKESIKETIQKRIDVYRKYLDEDLPKIHADELKAYATKWMNITDGEITVQTSVTDTVKTQSQLRIDYLNKEIAQIGKLINLTSSIPVPSTPLQQYNPQSNYVPYYTNNPSYSNSTVINIGSITLDGKKAETLGSLLKDVGLSVSSKG